MATTEFTGTDGCGAEAKPVSTVINEIKYKSNERLDYARQISQRLQDLRVRLVGDTPSNTEETGKEAATPKAEVEQLADTIHTMGAILGEMDSDLSMLERL